MSRESRSGPDASPRLGARRRPTVAGVSGGVGTTTLSVAIAGIDRGVFTGRGVDVLVCRASSDSLIRAGTLARLQAEQTGRQPLLAVTAVPAGLSRAVAARLKLTGAYARTVVTLPFVRRWREVPDPLAEAERLLRTTRGELPRAVRGYARAAHTLRAYLGATGPTHPARPASVAPRRPAHMERSR